MRHEEDLFCLGNKFFQKTFFGITLIRVGSEVVSGVNLNKKILCLPIIALMIVSFAATALCTPQTFVVPAGQVVSTSVALNQKDVCTGNLIAMGGTENDLIVYISDPNANYVGIYPELVYTNFNFTAPTTGKYNFTLDNSQGTIDKQVIFNYEVNAKPASTQSPGTVLGTTDITMIIVAVIVVIAVVVLVVLVVVSRRRKKAAVKASPPPPPS
jgi:hypothetical protein